MKAEKREKDFFNEKHEAGCPEGRGSFAAIR